MRRHHIGSLIVTAFLAVTVACGAQSSAVAKKDAANLFQELRTNRLAGDIAAGKVVQIYQILEQNELKLADINTTDGELLEIVRRGYHNDAMATLAHLKQMHGHPIEAYKVKTDIERYLREAGKTPKEIGSSADELNRLVARNALQYARQQGVTLTNADYRAAGIPVPVEIRTRTVRVPARPAAPTRKPAPPARSTAKPKPRA